MKKTNLTSFNFAVSGAETDIIKNGVMGSTVEIPHTWNVENGMEEYVGEAGKGKEKQRIHGSVDLYGNKKTSYDFIKVENKKDISK